jgi:hypothetical protein
LYFFTAFLRLLKVQNIEKEGGWINAIESSRKILIIKKTYARHTGEYQYPFTIRRCFNRGLLSSPQ